MYECLGTNTCRLTVQSSGQPYRYRGRAGAHGDSSGQPHSRQAIDIGSFASLSLSLSLDIDNHWLTCLVAQNSAIGAAGAVHIAQLIASNSCGLRKIHISDNAIGLDGIKPIADALASNTTLRTLGCARNHLGDAGARLLARALRANATLTALGVGGNSFTGQGVQAFINTLSENKTLVKIGVVAPSREFDLQLELNKRLSRNAQLAQQHQ